MESADDKPEPLTKPKKERTEKQKEAFEKAREARQKYLEEKKVQEKKQALKEIKNELNGKETANKKRDDTSEDDFIDVFMKKEDKKKEFPASDNKKTNKQILPDTDSDLNCAEKSEDYDDSTEEEITVIKRKKRKSKEKKSDVKNISKGVNKEKEKVQAEPKKERKIKKIIYESDTEEEAEEESISEEEAPQPTTRATKSQQNRLTKTNSQTAQPISRYYFGN
jgi:hypothetical protein